MPSHELLGRFVCYLHLREVCRASLFWRCRKGAAPPRRTVLLCIPALTSLDHAGFGAINACSLWFVLPAGGDAAGWTVEKRQGRGYRCYTLPWFDFAVWFFIIQRRCRFSSFFGLAFSFCLLSLLRHHTLLSEHLPEQHVRVTVRRLCGLFCL
jgi:hypothetical protein